MEGINAIPVPGKRSPEFFVEREFPHAVGESTANGFSRLIFHWYRRQERCLNAFFVKIIISHGTVFQEINNDIQI